jgi:hypothetical protein
MRFLLVMLAVAASLAPLVACEATKSGERDASPLNGTNELAPAAVQREVVQREIVQPEGAPSEALGARREAHAGPDALRAKGSPTAKSLTEASADRGAVPARPEGARAIAADNLTGDSLAARGAHPPTSIDEGGSDEGNGEPMDDVDDEEVPATDKSGADHPAAVDEESEGTGIKLQE